MVAPCRNLWDFYTVKTWRVRLNVQYGTLVISINIGQSNYTILRPGYLQAGEENDFVLTVKGQAAKGYTTTISSVVKLAADLILDENLYVRKSVSITREMI